MAASDAPKVDRERMANFTGLNSRLVCGRDFTITFGTTPWRVVFQVFYNPADAATPAQLSVVRRPYGGVATTAGFYFATWENYWQNAASYNTNSPWNGDRVGDTINMPVASGAWTVACRQKRADATFTDIAVCTMYVNGNAEGVDEGSPIIGPPNISLDKVRFRALSAPHITEEG